MTEFHERLKLAREAAGFKTATEAAKAMGIAPPTYLAHENGSRGGARPRNATVRQYARKFGVNYVWLWDGQGSMSGKTVEAVPTDDLAPEDVRILIDMAERLRQARRRGT